MLSKNLILEGLNAVRETGVPPEAEKILDSLEKVVEEQDNEIPLVDTEDLILELKKRLPLVIIGYRTRGADELSYYIEYSGGDFAVLGLMDIMHQRFRNYFLKEEE